MFELNVVNHDGKLVVDSRDVAQMVGKRHDHLMRDIQGYIAILSENAENPAMRGEGGAPNFGDTDFFIPSTYTSVQNKMMPCYLLTKQGCEMVANKLTGEKGVLFTAAYVQKFNAMEKHIKGEKLTSDEKLMIQRMKAEAMLNNSKVRKADLWAKFANMVSIPEHKQICAAYGTQELTGGEMVLPLPEIEKTYSAEDIGKMYGISANAVGRIANQNGLKTEAYGHLVLDKSRYSNKEVEVWRYNQAGADAIGKLIH